MGLRVEAAQKGAQGEKLAEPWYRKSLAALLRSERIELVQDEMNRAENAKRGKPGLTFVSSALYLHLGRTYQKLKDPAHAIQAFERGRALESDPDLLEDLATEYRAAGERRLAAQALVEALAVDSNRTQLMSKLVDLYAEIDPQGCSVSREGGSAGLNPDCPLVHGDICMASRNVAQSYVRSGQPEHAASIRKTATQELGCTPESVK
jgi:tetratricopeptide (TPR) repeat protein